MYDELKTIFVQEKSCKFQPKLLDDVTSHSYGLYLCTNRKSTRNERLSALHNFLDSTR